MYEHQRHHNAQNGEDKDEDEGRGGTSAARMVAGVVVRALMGAGLGRARTMQVLRRLPRLFPLVRLDMFLP